MSAWFYRIAWSLQLGFGLLLFAVAALLETLVLHAYLGGLWLALSLAAALEALKVLVIVGHRLLSSQTTVPYPRGVRWGALGFRGLLLGLSAACSLMFLAAKLDRPALESVRAADLAAIEARYQQDAAAFGADHDARRATALAALDQQSSDQHDALQQRYLPAIAALEQKLDTEMDNVQGGEFIGKRYRALQARLQTEKADYKQARTALNQRTDQQRAELLQRLDSERSSRAAARQQQREQDLAALRGSDYQGDPRVENPLARAFVNTLGAVFARPPSTLEFVFYFALFLSLTVEFGIWITFEHVTLARLPVFEAGFSAELYTASKAVETESELRGFEMDNELTKAKVRSRRRTIDEALSEGPSNPTRHAA
jgi:hypothetical protein